MGHGDRENQLAPRRVPAAALSGERIVMVAAGDADTVALSEARHVCTWGGCSFGRLGYNNGERQLAPRQVEAGRAGRGREGGVCGGRGMPHGGGDGGGGGVMASCSDHRVGTRLW